jgi:hypothetical protein
VLLTTKFLDVAKFTTLTPLSLLISCELSFLVIFKLELDSLEIRDTSCNSSGRA